jgi:hypothetical protein
MNHNQQKLTLIEFNELSPILLMRFMRSGDLPAFKAFYDSSIIYTTDAGETGPHLEPWVQWPTVHSGLPLAEHEVFKLGDGRRRLRHHLVGDLLSDAGIPVGIFASMNLNYEALQGYVVPDPWDIQGRAYPSDIQPYYRAVSLAIQESSRSESLTPKDLAGLTLFLLGHGLTWRTAVRLATHLLREQCNRGTKWRRASLLDEIQYDVARFLNERHQVRFATFFSNSTAHYQHYYWRNMEPELFDVPPSPDDNKSHREAIRYGYRSMDRLLARLMTDEPNALLVLCTGLSQQPWTDTTKQRFRPRNFQDLLKFARINVSEGAVKPVMAEEFQVEFHDEAAAIAAESDLLDLTANGSSVLEVSRDSKRIHAGCRLERPVPTVVRRFDGMSRPFDSLFYRIHTMRSGRHHPDGALWFRTKTHRVVDERVSLIQIAPTILAYFGVAIPEFMKGLPLQIGMGAHA